jgi:hypothetical protein
MLRQRLVDDNTRYDDTTLMVMLHLMSAEMWSCDDSMLQEYEMDVARTISARGGMLRLEDTAVTEFAAA